MKRFSSLESLGTMLYSPQEEKAKDNLVYSSEFQAMLDSLDDDECCIEENGHGNNGKKRRLSINQVQALEKIFEVDNKLDPEKKVKLAQELNLQPRQVAIWFQNRRARWKTKQLERDYNLLKADYDNLQTDHKKVEQEKQKLVAELKVLKKKLGEESSQNGVSEQGNDSFNPETNRLNSSELIINHEMAHDFNKDGSSDSDSSGILLLNHELNNYNNNNNQFLSKNSCSSMYYHPQLINSRPQMIREQHQHQQNQQQQQQQQRSLKTEELNLFCNLEETTTTCNIFSVDQPPNLYWYFPDDQSN